MSLDKLLQENRLKKHVTSKSEIEHLLQVAERDLKDCLVPGLSQDRKFATAYNAALQAGRAILAVKGYRTTGSGHHSTTFRALRDILGAPHHTLMDYFNDCRDKRNLVDYGVSGLVSEKEMKDLINEAKKFLFFTKSWMKENHYL